RPPVKDERNMKNGLGPHSETFRYIHETISGHMKGIDMKSSALAIAIVAAFTLSAGIVSNASAQTEQQKVDKVHRLNKDIRHDNRDIRSDKRDLHKDKNKLAHARAERNHDQMRENRAIEHGNVKGAEKWDQQRRAEQGQVNADKKDIRKDERDLNKDHADRNADVQDRNRAASGL
ncbi:MAG: hypothetical protein WAL20_03835, partial [Rhodomicrobium sp.]